MQPLELGQCLRTGARALQFLDDAIFQALGETELVQRSRDGGIGLPGLKRAGDRRDYLRHRATALGTGRGGQRTQRGDFPRSHTSL